MERIDQWPRVHSCLYDWCPKQSDECKRCDAVVKCLLTHKPKDEPAALSAADGAKP